MNSVTHKKPLSDESWITVSVDRKCVQGRVFLWLKRYLTEYSVFGSVFLKIYRLNQAREALRALTVVLRGS